MQRKEDQERLLNAEEGQQSEQEDDSMLGGEQDNASFVPAFSPQYNIDDDERCLLEREQDEVVQLTNAPRSGAALTYCVFYLLGIGTMTPWNFFVTAEDVSRARIATCLPYFRPALSIEPALCIYDAV